MSDRLVAATNHRAFGGSDVVLVSQTGHIEATDYVGQASRRYGLRQTPNVVCSCPRQSASITNHRIPITDYRLPVLGAFGFASGPK